MQVDPLEKRYLSDLKVMLNSVSLEEEPVEEFPYDLGYDIPARDTSMAKRLQDIERSIKIQCSEGNWNYDEYMFGMANGMLLVEATIKDTDPIFLNKPKKFLRKKQYTWGQFFFWTGAVIMWAGIFGAIAHEQFIK